MIVLKPRSIGISTETAAELVDQGKSLWDIVQEVNNRPPDTRPLKEIYDEHVRWINSRPPTTRVIEVSCKEAEKRKELKT